MIFVMGQIAMPCDLGHFASPPRGVVHPFLQVGSGHCRRPLYARA